MARKPVTAKVYTWAEANEMLGLKERLWLCHNTFLVRCDNNDIGVKYHKTVVVRIHQDGTYTVDTAGWYKNYSTRDRLKWFSPVHCFQHKGRWFRYTPGVPDQVPWQDGLTFDGFGRAVPRPGPAQLTTV
jgi:hypothetical protein